MSIKCILQGQKQEIPKVTLETLGAASATDLTSHISNKSNPHGVTTAQIGAATVADLIAHTGNLNNPHNVTTALINAVNKAGDTMTGNLVTNGQITAAGGFVGNLTGNAATVGGYTIDQILSAAASSGCKIETGSYTGTSNSGHGTNSLTFSFQPQLILVSTSDAFGIMRQNFGVSYWSNDSEEYSIIGLNVTSSNNTITWQTMYYKCLMTNLNTSISESYRNTLENTSNTGLNLNRKSRTYDYVAIG